MAIIHRYYSAFEDSEDVLKDSLRYGIFLAMYGQEKTEELLGLATLELDYFYVMFGKIFETLKHPGLVEDDSISIIKALRDRHADFMKAKATFPAGTTMQSTFTAEDMSTFAKYDDIIIRASAISTPEGQVTGLEDKNKPIFGLSEFGIMLFDMEEPVVFCTLNDWTKRDVAYYITRQIFSTDSDNAIPTCGACLKSIKLPLVELYSSINN